MNIISIITNFIADIGKTRLTLSSIEFIKSLTSEKNESEIIDSDQTAVKNKPNKFLDLLTSPGVGTILTVFGVMSYLYSPLGIVIGGTVATITTTSYSLSMIRATLRMKTIKNTQNKDLLLDIISEKIQISSKKQLNPQFKKMVNEEIKKIINKKISDEKTTKQKSSINSISGNIRYISLTGAANWVLSIITLNPISIALSSTSMIVNNGLSYHGETNYRKGKDLLDRDVLEKENKLTEYLKIELGIEDKFINELSNNDLLKILSIKEAELSCHNKSYSSLEDMEKEFIKHTKSYEDINLEEFHIQRSFTQDFAYLFSSSFSSEKYGELFCPLIHRQENEQLEQKTYSEIIASSKNDELKGKDKSMGIEMVELSSNNLSPDKLERSASTRGYIIEEKKPTISEGYSLKHSEALKKQSNNLEKPKRSI